MHPAPGQMCFGTLVKQWRPLLEVRLRPSWDRPALFPLQSDGPSFHTVKVKIITSRHAYICEADVKAQRDEGEHQRVQKHKPAQPGAPGSLTCSPRHRV